MKKEEISLLNPTRRIFSYLMTVSSHSIFFQPLHIPVLLRESLRERLIELKGEMEETGWKNRNKGAFVLNHGMESRLFD